jgi:hypothetical protein
MTYNSQDAENGHVEENNICSTRAEERQLTNLIRSEVSGCLIKKGSPIPNSLNGYFALYYE